MSLDCWSNLHRLMHHTALVTVLPTCAKSLYSHLFYKPEPIILLTKKCERTVHIGSYEVRDLTPPRTSSLWQNVSLTTLQQVLGSLHKVTVLVSGSMTRDKTVSFFGTVSRTTTAPVAVCSINYFEFNLKLQNHYIWGSHSGKVVNVGNLSGHAGRNIPPLSSRSNMPPELWCLPQSPHEVQSTRPTHTNPLRGKKKTT
jgi:hypothetical protein